MDKGGAVIALSPVASRWLRIFGIALVLFVLPIALLYPFADAIVEQALALGSMSPTLAFLAVIGLLLLDAVAAIPHGFIGALAGAALPWAAAWAATWLGLMGASSISYGIGRFAGRPLASRIVGKADMDAAEKRAGSISALLLFATRPVPVVGEVILVAAGIANYPFRRFVIAIRSANALLSLGYVGIGQYLGEGQNERIALIAAIGMPLIGATLYFAGVAFSRLARTS